MKTKHNKHKTTNTIDILPLEESVLVLAMHPEFHARHCTMAVCDCHYDMLKGKYPLSLTCGILFLKRLGAKNLPDYLPAPIREAFATNNADGYSWQDAKEIVLNERLTSNLN